MTALPPISSPAPQPTSTSGSRRTGLLVAGAIVLAAGIIAAAVLWSAAGQRHDEAITSLARAPIGCDTTLDFAETGTYLIFVETKGSLTDVDGNCTAIGDFEWTGNLPAVRVQLFDGDGDSVDLPRQNGVDYDAAGSRGTSIRSVDIVDVGPYVVRVESPEPGVAVAIGRDPMDGVGLLKNLAALSAICGLIGGGILLVLGARRTTMVTAPATPQWPGPTAAGPVSPPGMPQPGIPHAPGWQPALGPPTSLRPPGQPPAPPSEFAAPRPATPVADPAMWAPQPPPPPPSSPPPPSPQQPPPSPPGAPPRRDADDSGWAPPSE